MAFSRLQLYHLDFEQICPANIFFNQNTFIANQPGFFYDSFSLLCVGFSLQCFWSFLGQYQLAMIFSSQNFKASLASTNVAKLWTDTIFNCTDDASVWNHRSEQYVESRMELVLVAESMRALIGERIIPACEKLQIDRVFIVTDCTHPLMSVGISLQLLLADFYLLFFLAGVSTTLIQRLKVRTRTLEACPCSIVF